MASVVVVGGGLAGLTCAFRLRQAGHDVEILEREADPGGRLRSETHGEFVIDRGARLFTRADRHLLELAGALGIESRVQPVACPGQAVLRDNRFHPADPASPLRLASSGLLSPTARARLLRLGANLASQWRVLDADHPERAAGLDFEDLVAGLRERVGQEASAYLFGPLFSASFGCEPEDLSYAFGLLMLRRWSRGPAPQCFAGGAAVLPRALADQVPVRTGCEAFWVETQTAGARVRYRSRGREHSVLADAAVVAVASSRVGALCPKLTPDERGFFETVREGRAIVAHLLLERAPAELRWNRVAFPRGSGLDLYGIDVAHHRRSVAPSGAGLLSALFTRDTTARLWDAPVSSVAQVAVESLARTPIGRVQPADVVVHRFDPYGTLFSRGYLPRLARFLRRVDRSPRLAFAGSYRVAPTAEGAVTSGIRAATEILREI